ncbi:MAG: nitrilase-related carbon-nitrogen hydrolase, partial [Desulfobacteraceae bacterium]
MKIAINQTNPVIGDFDHNAFLIKEAVKRARSEGCALVVFPEIPLIGYPPKDLLEKPAFVRDNLEHFHRLAAEIRDIHVLCGYVEKGNRQRGNRLYNSVALLGDGRVLASGGKRLLPTYDVFDEARYFDPAPQSLIFELQGKTFGVTVCEDIWNVGDIQGVPAYDLNPVEELVSAGVDILVNVSASPYTLDKPPLRMSILERLAASHSIPVVYCNQVGGNDDLLFDGASMVMDRDGRLVMAGNEFEEDMLVWDTEAEYPEIEEPWLERDESLLKGLVMGTRDYAAKCGFKRVLVGLSGGLD